MPIDTRTEASRNLWRNLLDTARQDGLWYHRIPIMRDKPPARRSTYFGLALIVLILFLVGVR